MNKTEEKQLTSDFIRAMIKGAREQEPRNYSYSDMEGAVKALRRAVGVAKKTVSVLEMETHEDNGKMIVTISAMDEAEKAEIEEKKKTAKKVNVSVSEGGRVQGRVIQDVPMREWEAVIHSQGADVVFRNILIPKILETIDGHQVVTKTEIEGHMVVPLKDFDELPLAFARFLGQALSTEAVCQMTGYQSQSRMKKTL